MVAFGCGQTPKSASDTRPPLPEPPPALVSPAPKAALAIVRSGEIMRERCAGCHNESHVLDLRAPPAEGARETWRAIAEAVDTGKMPPSAPGNRFPLDPAVRNQLMKDAYALAAKLVSPVPVTAPVKAKAWVGALHDFADPFVGVAAVDTVIDQNKGGIGGLRTVSNDRLNTSAGFLFPLAFVNINVISAELCSLVIGASAAGSGERQLPKVEGPSPQRDAAVHSLVRELYRQIYREEPNATDIDGSVALWGRLFARTKNANDATVALCTAQLAGPRLLMLPVTR